METVDLVLEPTELLPALELSERFRRRVLEELHDAGMTEGSELVISCRFLGYDEGSRFQRWFTGGISDKGQAQVAVEATFRDRSGREVGKIEAVGEISMGFFGGSAVTALDRAADQVSAFTLSNFRRDALP